MPRKPLVVNGQEIPLQDGEQTLLDMEEVRERLRLFHKALLEEETAEETVKSLQTQLARAKLKLTECRRAVRLYSSRERKRARGEE